jgi:hypothetical protein
MIDQTLISTATNHASVAIQNSTPVTDKFRLINNVLSQDLLDKIKKFIDTVDNSEWKLVPWQEFNPRTAIHWIPESVIEEIHCIGVNLTDQINKIFNISDKKFQGLQLWKDIPGYINPRHQDNPIIDVSMQIYLFDCPSKYGTTFELEKEQLNLPFKHNTGYIINQKPVNERLWHWTTNRLVDDYDRYSLYFIWGVGSNGN